MDDKKTYQDALARRETGPAKKFSVSATVPMVLRHEVTAANTEDAKTIFEYQGQGDDEFYDAGGAEDVTFDFFDCQEPGEILRVEKVEE